MSEEASIRKEEIRSNSDPLLTYVLCQDNAGIWYCPCTHFWFTCDCSHIRTAIQRFGGEKPPYHYWGMISEDEEEGAKVGVCGNCGLIFSIVKRVEKNRILLEAEVKI